MIEKATLGGGCFWCVEAVFEQLQGVISVVSGYAGGTKDTANYEAVCSGTTDHAEVIQLSFDNTKIDFKTILEVFFTTHDPTTLNQQGADKGPQYRSVIFYHDEQQKLIANESKSKFAPQFWNEPIVTEISPLDTFYEAEVYHQSYFADNPNQPYCMFVINPKVQKFRKQFSNKLKPDYV